MKKHFYLIVSILLISLITTWFVLINNGNYGTTLFFTIPASIAFLIGYSQKYQGLSKTKFKSIVKGFFKIMLIVCSSAVILILSGIEGAICILMAYPFLVLPMFFSYIIGVLIGSADRKNSLNSIMLLIIINPTSYIYDSFNDPINELVETQITINYKSKKIWKELTTQIDFDNKPKLIFKKGVSCPTYIKLNENNLTYECYTNNDTIKLKIIEFIPNQKVKFILANQTVPMKEITPYKSIDAKHLHNYFNVKYGEISLNQLDDKTTKITAKTYYNYKIAPKWYWKLWSNYIINEMHLHVLNSLKTNLDESKRID